ncbi:heterokaryon incompatibility protein-domain-containing protein [Paraphoma chrysanthemicola]|uniref:Heterokaryon incompatibility protein-domain-containing protein n=1 Tax=Paraphoma chrysanthemicola TaxID=798071 RepID=A0A8K0RBF0_9PLEO|nr:heterokaryon incompatibility protein-domain-containing protein [Paraphoma chrysanthemicola]
MAHTADIHQDHTFDHESSLSSRILEKYPQPAQHPLSTICLVCRSLFFRPGDEENRASVSHDEESFAASSETCFVCITIKSRNLTALKAPNLTLTREPEGPLSSWTLWSEQIVSGGKTKSCLAMKFHPSSTLSGVPMIETDPLYHSLEHPLVAINPQLITESTAGDACFDLIKRWQHVCMEEHNLCREARVDNLKFQLPTRLIDVRAGPRLVAGSTLQSSQSVQYVTLSHRWQEGSSAKLLKSSIDSLMKAIDITALPPVFQDAITATRRLGIDLLWIDALCIIQDDAEDWRLESSRMGSVYQNATLNLGASGGSIPRLHGAFDDILPEGPAPVGLFMSRRVSDFLIPHVEIARKGFSRTHFGFDRDIQAQSHSQVPLLRRGWVFQERLLSPRSVYFGEQLTWECPELLANESFPEGSPGFHLASPWNNNAPFRLSRLLSRPNFNSLEYANNVIINDLYRTWLNLVMDYRHCDLTFQSDALPAISGLVRGFRKMSSLSGIWMYGLFRMDLIRGLLWNRCVLHCTEIAAHPPAQRNIPSWSWAATDLPVDFPHVHDVFGTETEVFLATADSEVNFWKLDMTSSLTSSPIKIVGCLRPNRNTTLRALMVDPEKSLRYDYMEVYDWEHDENEIPACEDTYLLMLTCKPAKPTTLAKDKVRGLILKPTGRVPDEYRRVGAFALDPSTREEFAGLDFTDLDKQVIMLV